MTRELIVMLHNYRLERNEKVFVLGEEVAQ